VGCCGWNVGGWGHAVGVWGNKLLGFVVSGPAGCCCGGGWCGGLFENCIVGVSIFSVVVFSSLLGHTVDALASGAEEGRCSLRYASGSWQANCDPRVSEWGNPAGVMPGHPCLNV